MEKVCKENYSLARKLSSTYINIHDLICLNSDGLFDESRGEIYPSSLKLNKENTEDSEATFLDLSIKVQNKMFHTTLYDKLDDFNFSVVNFPNLSGNIPKKTSYGVLISQILRYVSVCMDCRDFVLRSRCLILIEKLRSQFYCRDLLMKTFRKFIRRYQEKLKKFDVPHEKMTEDLFSV